MAKTVPVEIRVTGLPHVRQFIASVAALLEVVGRYDMPQPVGEAVAHLQRDMAALSDDAPSGEDRVRDAMAEAHDHPGRVVTR